MDEPMPQASTAYEQTSSSSSHPRVVNADGGVVADKFSRPDSQDPLAPYWDDIPLRVPDDFLEDDYSYGSSSYSQSSDEGSYPEQLKSFIAMFDRPRSPDE